MSKNLHAALVRRLLEFPYLPSSLDVVDAALDLIEVKPGEIFVDLGCGDGRVLVRAAKKLGVYCIGFEINPNLALLAHRRAKDFGVGHLVDVVCADIFTLDFSRFNVIYVYTFPTILEKLSKKIIEECSEGTRVLVHDYPLKGLNPVRSIEVRSDKGGLHIHRICFYIL